MSKRFKVVAIGGGTGLATVLRSLKHYPISLSGIVTMTDNGASSGRLSRELGTLPPGDVRNCLTALAEDETLLKQLFEYRFERGRGLSGHSLGNLLLLALADITGDFESAVEASSKILSIKGEVIPSTLDHVNIVGKLKNNQMALGQVDIPLMGHRFGIDQVELLPPDTAANPNAVHFIQQADLIIAGPGSLLTSIVPNFLIREIREAYEKSSAIKLFICNVSTERGETENFSVEDHITELRRHVGDLHFDAVLVNSKVVKVAEQEGRIGSITNFTTSDKEAAGVPVMLADLIDEDRPLYHDSRKLSRAIWQLIARQENPVNG